MEFKKNVFVSFMLFNILNAHAHSISDAHLSQPGAIVFAQQQEQTASTATKSNNKKDNKKSQSSEGFDPSEADQFVQAMYEIKKYYVEPVDDKKLFQNAIRGMMQGLDPHSDYLDEEEFNDLKVMTSGEFAGVGMEVMHDDNGYLKVISPLENSPATKSGIQPGDVILKIDNLSSKGMTVRQAVHAMRGQPGSAIKLTLFRKEAPRNPITVSVVREVIKVASVKKQLLPGNYGYIRITQFQSQTGKDFIKAIADLKKESNGKLQGLVLDLRNNPGGLLDAAVEVSDALIDADSSKKDSLILFTKGRVKEQQTVVHAEPGNLLENVAIVTLINEGSASAAEIVAGALQDNRRSLIVGTRSFGKGSVQTILPLGKNRGLKLTTARYYTPSGRSIQARGIEPDLVIENLKVAISKDEDKRLEMHESDLQGHLNNDTAVKKNKNSLQDIKDEHILSKDYQLYQALQTLKTINLNKEKYS